MEDRMKVELDDIRLGFSDITGTVYAYIPSAEGHAKHQKNVTKDFEACKVIQAEDTNCVMKRSCPKCGWTP